MNIEMHVLAPMSFYGESFKTKYELKEAIRECEKGKEMAENALYKLVYMTDPSKFMDKDDERSPEQWLDERIEAIKEDLQTAYVDLYRYNILLEMWDKWHMVIDGKEKAITIPKDLNDKEPIYDHIYGEGDYMDVVFPDGTPAYN